MSKIDKITVKNIEYDIEDSSKQEILVSGENIKTLNGESILGSGDLEFATPEQGNKAETAVQPEDIVDFITASVDNLVNYYLKSETYNKTEVDNLISAIKTGIFQVVETLPTATADTMNIIYLVPSTDPNTQNIKDEYITVRVDNNYQWEKIGSTAIDLTGYATESWVNTQISDFLTQTQIQELINTAVSNKYTKPNTGIPKTDLASGVQTSLAKADTALQEHQDISGKADKSEIPDVSDFITKDVNNLTNYTLKTSTGSLIDLEINSSTYVVTLSLKDIDGNVISTDTIDLPLESVVVSGSFDNINKKIVLTLQNGNTVDIPVGDLIAGLQTEITSTNKLASDLVDDSNSGNKFVTTSEKSTWNAKYTKPASGIPKTDMTSEVQASLAKADTAIQDISGKVDKASFVYDSTTETLSITI